MMNEIPRKEYPRPQFVRQDWLNLNGTWTYELDPGDSGLERDLQLSKGFNREILVPFCLESELSGAGHKDFTEQMFYHRKITVPEAWRGRKILLHFGGVDYECTGFLDGQKIGYHFGGSASFFFDITEYARYGEEQDLVLYVRDHLRIREQPAGKQCTGYKSRGCNYTRTTGIWQTVWMEPVSVSGLKKCRIIPDLDNASFSFQPEFFGESRNLRWKIQILAEGKTVAEGEFSALSGMTQVLKVSELRTWSPEDPFLYDIVFEVIQDGITADRVESYAGMRKIHIEGNKCYLNNQEIFFRLVLDQGFYRTGIWTAPSDADLKKDIELSMAAGFNGARLHQKVFEPRFHYWADKLGYLTWGESPSWGLCFSNFQRYEDPVCWRSVFNFLHEWREIMDRDFNSPSIIVWTPLNETWCSGDAPLFRKIMTEVYDQTKSFDPTRPCNECSGYHHAKTDFWTVHLYRKTADELKKAMETKPVFMQDAELEQEAYHGQPFINDEFGGFLYLPPEKTSRFADNTWGYYGIEIKTPEEFAAKIKEQVYYMSHLESCAGFCYTQLTDVEQEQNGVLTYDREPKIPLELLRDAFLA